LTVAQARPGERLEREREFHNDRFGAPASRKEDAFYFAARAAGNEYWRLIGQAAAGRDVLEYGCSTGQSSIGLAKSARHVTGVDISDVAIGQAQNAAVRESIANVTFRVGDAEKMDLPSASFDLVFGSGILHHLDLDVGLKELRRVLRPGGKAVFFEPLGHNPAINYYRSRTPQSRTADEHPLLKSDLDIVRRHFSRCDPKFFGLTTLASIPFRSNALGRALRAAGEQVDDVLLRIPGLKWQAWIVVMDLEP
jgi:SAM-dependent methyltransferase